jgi:tRNA(Arg) A34 adenosine deaminase TadA
MSPDVSRESKMTGLRQEDIAHLEAVVKLAAENGRQGASPFAARLVDGHGAVLLDAVNTVRKIGDVTAHAETVLLRKAGAYSREQLGASTLYASTEPCAMCAAAICWSYIGRVVFALSHEKMRELSPRLDREPGITGKALFEMTPGAPKIIGPVPQVRPERPFE